MFDVAIIIPVYNNERSISRCLDSIINQKTNRSFQVILVRLQRLSDNLSLAVCLIIRYGLAHIVQPCRVE